MTNIVKFLLTFVICVGPLHAGPSSIPQGDSDLIFSDRFEENSPAIRVVEALPRIEFISDRSVLLTSANPEARVSAVVLDENGDRVDGAQVTWSSEANNILEISPIGLSSAVITALDELETSQKVFAEYAPFGIQGEVYVTQAELVPGTVFLPSVAIPDAGGVPESEDELIIEVQGNRFDNHVLVLRKTPQTSSLAAGDILLTGDYAGILVRVLTSTLRENAVELSVEPASITNAIQDINLVVQSSTATLDGLFTSPGFNRTTVNRNTESRAISAETILDKLECEGSTKFKEQIDLSGMEVNPSWRVTGELSISEGIIDRFMLVGDYNIRLVGALGLNFAASIQAAASCTARFKPIAFAKIPLSAIQIRPLITPIASVSGSLSAETAGTVQTPRRGIQLTGFGSVRYASANGWELDGDATATDIKNDVFDTDLAGGLNISGTASATALGGLAIDLGKGRASLEILNLGLIKGDFSVISRLFAKTTPSSTNYGGPQASVVTSQSVSGVFSAELFNGTLGEYLGLSIESDLSIDLDSATQPVLGQPSFIPRLENAPSGNDFRPGDQLIYIVSGSTDASGSVELLVAQPNAVSADPIATFPIVNGSGQVTLPIGQFEPGEYILFPRIRLDETLFGYTNTLPLTGGRNVSFSVLP